MKLITVTGNKCSGKTHLAFWLGVLLSKQNRTLVIHADSQYPIIKCLFPDECDKCTKSLGKAMLAPIPNKEDIVANIVPIENYPNLGLMSYAPNETIRSFPVSTEQKLFDTFAIFNSLADYLIVDCDSEKTPFTEFAMAHSNSNICLTTADYRGICYRNNIFIPESTIHVLSELNPENITPVIAKGFAKEPYILPLCKQFYGVYNGADITSISLPSKYIKVLEKIISEVVK